MTKDIYTAALVIIGDEILSGRTHDKNIPYVAEKLNEVGVRLQEVRVIPDDQEIIVKTVNEMREAHNYVFTTGGIGPTHDDITAESIAVAFGVELELCKEAYQNLFDYYKDPTDITESRKKMAYIPKGAALVENPVSGAPGINIDNVYVFAGVPRIMQAMLDSILPDLIGGDPVISRSVTCQIPESLIADDLGIVQDKYNKIAIGSYPKYQNGGFSTILVVRGTNAQILEEAVQDIVIISQKHGDHTPLVE